MIRDYLEEAEKLYSKLSNIRRDIHAHPELGNQEFRTAEKVEAILNGLGIETKRLTETAVMGVLKLGGNGKTAALRADMDALPLTEETGCDFASQSGGVMHACGHDIHTAAVIGAAMLLAGAKDKLHGEVRFLFQPDEEGDGGAQRMIAAGAVEGVDAVFGGHVEPVLPKGTIGVRYGKFYAASDMFDIAVHGKTAHGAEPENGIDALTAAANLVVKLKAIPSKLRNEKCILNVGTFYSGTARNILSGEAKLSGTIRTLGEDTRAWADDMLEKAILETEAETGTCIELKLVHGYPGVVNHDKPTDIAKTVAEELFGADNVRVIQEPTMTTEDFGYFLQKVPGTFVHMGVGGEWPLHNPRFLPDDDACVRGAAYYAAIVAAFLMEKDNNNH